MANLPSQQSEALACEALSDDELQAVSGGVALVTGRIAQGVQLTTGRIVNPGLVGGVGGIRPIICLACVQGVPSNLVTNPAFNQVLRAGF